MIADRSDASVDREIGNLATVVGPQRSVISQVLGWFSRLWQTPNRSAATAVWLVALLVMIVTAAHHADTTVRSQMEVAKVTCGINTYLYGDPDPAVANTCRSAEAGDAALFLISGVIVVAGLVAAFLILRPFKVRRRTLALTVAGGVAAIAGLLALRPVPAPLFSGGELDSLRCGADTYFFGYPDRAIQTACGNAYSTQGHILEVAIVVVLGVLAGLLARTWRRQWPWIAAVGLALAALVSLAPLNVSISADATPEVATCGLDTFLVGYPDAAVQHDCRAQYADRAAIGLPAGVLAVGATVFAVAKRRRAA